MSSLHDGGCSALLPDGRILVAGGSDANGPTANVDVFNADGTWSTVPAMISPRAHQACAVLQNGQVLTAGGVTTGGAVTNSAELFDPSANTWTQLPAMSEARAGANASLLQDGRVLLAAGQTSSGASNTLEIFDPNSETFSFAGTLSAARKDAAAAVLQDGRVLIIGGSGWDANGNPTVLASSDIYDPNSGTVANGPALMTARSRHSAIAQLDGKVVVIGGNDGSNDLASIEVYDPSAGGNFVAASAALATPRSGQLAFLLPKNNEVLVAGGQSAGVDLASAELYVPWGNQGAGAVQSTAAMSTARSQASGSALGAVDGLLLVAGGSSQSSAELYSFATVSTDQADYAPGTTVTITGSGWQPGETVTLTLVESPLIDTHPAMTAVADQNGNIFNNQFSPDSHDVNVRFYLTATGSQSQAQNTFTDAPGDTTSTAVACSPSSLLAGTTTTCTATVTNTQAGAPNGAPQGAVTFSFSGTGTFTPSSCTVAPVTGSNPPVSNCQVSLTPTAGGSGLNVKGNYNSPNPPNNNWKNSTSPNFSLSVTNPVPSISSLSPASATAGASQQTLTINGTNFVSTSTVTYNGVAHTATFVSATQVTIVLSAGDQATAGSYAVVVTNPAPGGGRSNSVNFVVNPAIQATTLTVSPASGTYGGTTNLSATLTATSGGAPVAAVSVSFSLNGTPVGSAATNSSGIASLSNVSLAGIDAGSYNTGVSASFAGNASYSASSGSATLSVGQAAQTITFAAIPSHTYGDVPFAISPTATSGLAVSLSATGNCTLSASTAPANVTITGAGSCSITATQAGNTDYSAATPAPQSFSIGQAALTVTASAQSKVYGTADPTLTYQITSGALVGSDTLTGSLTRNPGENVGTYAITIGTLSAGSNYTITFVSADLTITPRPVTVTADAQTKVYGDADPALTYKITSGTLVTGDNFSGTLTRVAGENVGTYAIQQGSLTLGNNYTLSFVGANLTITPRPVTVTADGKSKVYGDSDPALTYQITSGNLVNGDTFSGALTRAAGENVGTYAITQGTLALSTNYTLSYVGANLTITPRPITVTADAQTKIYGNPDPTLTYKITSGSLAFTDSFSGALSRAAGENVGTYAITQGTLALSTNYTLSYVGANLTITPRPITVTADGKTKVYGDSDPALTYQITSGSLAFNDNFSGALSRAAGENVGAYAIQQGTLALSTNYTLTYVGANLTITPRPITVTADAQTKVYGNPDPTLTYKITSGSLAFTDSFSGALNRAAGENVGTYAITQGTLALSTNYTLSYAGANLTITARPITVTADSKTKVYGDSDPALTYQITSGSLAFSDAFAGSLTRAPGETVGSYAILQGTLVLSTNYNLSYVGANLTITPRPASVTPNAASKVYGAADPTLSGTLSGFLASDNVVASYSRTAGESVAGSPYLISAVLSPAGVLGNYTITYNTANFTITPAPLLITAGNGSMIYGDTLLPVITPASYAGFVNGDTSLSLTTQPTCSPNVTSITPVGNYQSTCTGAVDSNYTITYAPGTVKVNPRPVTAAISAANKTYDGTTSANITSCTLTGVVNSDNVSCTATGTFDQADAGARTVTANVSLTGNAMSNYVLNPATATTAATINKANQTITWATPTPITYGTPLSATQLNATVVGVPNCSTCTPTGALTYIPPAGTVLGAGNQTLTVTAAATENYNAATGSVGISVNKATPTVNWSNPANIIYGTPLSGTQLNATFTWVAGGSTVTVAGAAMYTPAAGTVLNPGQGQTLSVSFMPTDTADYNSTSGTTTIGVVFATGVTCNNGMSSHVIQPPININGSSVFKGGSTVPTKFAVCDSYGNSVGPNGAFSNIVARYVILAASSGTINTATDTLTSTTPDTAFRWDSTAQQWIYNTATGSGTNLRANTTYWFQIVLIDGTIIGQPATTTMSNCSASSGGCASFAYGLK